MENSAISSLLFSLSCPISIVSMLNNLFKSFQVLETSISLNLSCCNVQWTLKYLSSCPQPCIIIQSNTSWQGKPDSWMIVFAKETSQKQQSWWLAINILFQCQTPYTSIYTMPGNATYVHIKCWDWVVNVCGIECAVELGVSW